jgi:hypothetical protein
MKKTAAPVRIARYGGLGILSVGLTFVAIQGQTREYIYLGGRLVAIESLNPNLPPATVSVAPSSGTGATQLFSLVYSDANGYSDLTFVQFLIASSASGDASQCLVHYDVAGNGLWLYGDSGYFLGPVTPGVNSNALVSSGCAVSTAESSRTLSGNTVTLRASITFKIARTANLYMRAMDSASHDTGWVPKGNWTSTVAAASMSILPAMGGGLVGTFTGTYSDPAGFSGLNYGFEQMLVAKGEFSASPPTPFCFVHYDRAGNGLWIYGDSGYFVGPVTPGTSSSLLQNTACSVDTGNSTAQNMGGSPNSLRLALPLSFKQGDFNGGMFTALRTYDSIQRDSGWQSAGSWMVPAGSAVSISPGNPSLTNGEAQQFTATVTVPGSGSVNWTHSGPGTFTPNGLNFTYTAPSSISSPDTASVTATSQTDPSKSDTASISLIPPPKPDQLAVTPINGVGASAVFSFTMRQRPNGQDIDGVQPIFSPNDPLQSTVPNGCRMYYTPMTNPPMLFLDRDAGDGFWLDSSQLGAGGHTLSNSSCQVDTTNSSATFNGTQMSLNLKITFLGSSRILYVYNWVENKYGGSTDVFVRLGTWTTQ